ncbi:MAG: arsenite methyltransferase [Thermoanaerobaculia bacterium]
MSSTQPDEIVTQVRERYGELAREGASCCGPTTSTGDLAHAIGYREADLEELPPDANLGLGCGAPVPLLDLQPGETVLDLGSGPGLDVFIAAKAVGPTGRVIGVDMTPEMIDRATAAAERLGLDHVEFRLGRLEALPLDDASVDAVTSNCVLNLVPDKRAVFREIARVLRPGGRLVVADLVLAKPLPGAVATDVAAWCGCVGGAMPREDYFAALAEAGLQELTVLKESDYVSIWAQTDPEGLRALAERTGTTPEELANAVVSVTYRAERRRG